MSLIVRLMQGINNTKFVLTASDLSILVSWNLLEKSQF